MSKGVWALQYSRYSECSINIQKSYGRVEYGMWVSLAALKGWCCDYERENHVY